MNDETCGNEPVCARCHESYKLRDGCEPTKYCDDCAHAVVEEMEGKLSRVARLIVLLEQKNDGQTDIEVAVSASFQEAVLATENDELEARVKELEFKSSCNDTDMPDAELVAALSDELGFITDDVDNGISGTILSKVRAMKGLFAERDRLGARVKELEEQNRQRGIKAMLHICEACGHTTDEDELCAFCISKERDAVQENLNAARQSAAENAALVERLQKELNDRCDLHSMATGGWGSCQYCGGADKHKENCILSLQPSDTLEPIKSALREIANLTAGNSRTEPNVNDRCILNLCHDALASIGAKEKP